MGKGCHGPATDPLLWDKFPDTTSWKGVIPGLPDFAPPKGSGKDTDKQKSIDFATDVLDKTATRLQQAINAKKGWISSQTNGVSPTVIYTIGNAYSIYCEAQDFIGALNLIPNHDPYTRKKKPTSGDIEDPLPDAGETPKAIANFVDALLHSEDTTVADETIPQDPTSNGEPVPTPGVDPDGSQNQ